MEHKKFSIEFAKRKLTVEIGKINNLSNGCCFVYYGNTTVMVNVTMAKKQREDIDFFPLSVDYEEKLYAFGKIPGSFLKREGKPSENAILVARCIDRSIRPFFPKDMKNEVSIVATVLSLDLNNSPEVCAMLGVAVALTISDIPWNGPVVGVNVGIVDGEIVLNPNLNEAEKSVLNLTVSANSEKIAMIEAEANEVSEEKMLECIETAHSEIKKIIDFINEEIKPQCFKEKFEYGSTTISEEILNYIEENSLEKIKDALNLKDKAERDLKIQKIMEEMKLKCEEKFEDLPFNCVESTINKLEKKIVRDWLFNENKRVDGRKMDEIRPLSCEVNFLPVVHGCGLFSRGLTKTMSIVTLGSLSEEQKLDGLTSKTSKRYIHHYNFPSYSVGETRPNRAPGRREIGHGALAEKALRAVIPSVEEFPYTIRVVSETISSNGSTSQASICSSTLALMDAGVPIKAPVAGISCGLITNEDGEFSTMLDIQGLEDFFGDMDFKVAGTKKGITAIQVDVKIDGLSFEIIKEVFEKTKKARINIIENIITPVIASPRETVKETAPKIKQMLIPIEKIKDLIGPNGRTVQKISTDYNVKIEIQEDGTTYILGNNFKDIEEAIKIIKTIIISPKVGEIYNGVVSKIMPFGAFVEIAPGKEGLVHISNLDFNRVERIEDVIKIKDKITVKVIEIDSQGRINLSRKDALNVKRWILKLKLN